MPSGRSGQQGFTLAAMIIIMAVMAILLTVAVQTVTFQQKREKEEELIFRGKQMIEGIRLFRARFGRFPLKLEELEKANPKVLRKKWKDPITGKNDWVPVFVGQQGQQIPVGGQPQATPTPEPEQAGDAGGDGAGGDGPPGGQGPQGGPIIGVRSRSCEKSIKLYDNRSRYCDWKFSLDSNQQQGGRPGPRPTGGPVVPTPVR